MTPNYRSTRLACYTAYVVQAITVNRKKQQPISVF